MLIRFDDYSIRSDFPAVDTMINIATEAGHDVMIGVSLLVFTDAEKGRVFPADFTARSDVAIYFGPDDMGHPQVPVAENITIASHGLWHCDHRLIPMQTAAASILTSCTLLGCHHFVPPYNKWNDDMVEICDCAGIELIRFEDGWKSGEHHQRAEFPDCKMWYFHPWCTTPAEFYEWLNGKEPARGSGCGMPSHHHTCDCDGMGGDR
jgi:hypothetical protein